MSYHYGQTIREYREKKHMMLSDLACKWPSKETGVTSRYVSDIEHGKKYISDISLLRALAKLLDIPLWKFGLSEYNPFSDQIEQYSSFFDSTLLEELIKDTWVVRLSMPINMLEQKIISLSQIFEKLQQNNMLLRNNSNFLRLRAELKRLQAVLFLEKKDYAIALSLFQDMLHLAANLQDNAMLALAHMSIGNELMREKHFYAAFPYLEKSHDLLFSFHPSKELSSLVSGMFARFYAHTNNIRQFEKNSDYAVNAASNLDASCFYYRDGVYHSLSYAMEQKTYGYILLNKGDKAIKVLPNLEKQIRKEQNVYLSLWYLLDYAMAFYAINEIEESVRYLRFFYERTGLMQTQHMQNIIYKNLDDIEVKGYRDLTCVKEFREMLQDNEKH